PGGTADEAAVLYQSQSRPDAGIKRPANAACARRRGHRIRSDQDGLRLGAKGSLGAAAKFQTDPSRAEAPGLTSWMTRTYREQEVGLEPQTEIAICCKS